MKEPGGAESLTGSGLSPAPWSGTFPRVAPTQFERNGSAEQRGHSASRHKQSCSSAECECTRLHEGVLYLCVLP